MKSRTVFQVRAWCFLLALFGYQTTARAVDPIQNRQPSGSVVADAAAPDRGQMEGAVEPFIEPRHPHRGGWFLGVFGRYTTTGHLLTRVYPNTPASRAGLEPGDRIVTVNGQQIGEVLNRQYPIDTLLQRHATRDGFVRLLVQDQRSGRLVNVDVRLTRGEVHF